MTDELAIPIRKRRIAKRMEACLEELGALMSPWIRKDERGPFVNGFYSRALAARAEERPEFGTWAWLESEGARLIFDVLELDRAGDRTLAMLIYDASDPASPIIGRARLRIPHWCANSVP